MSSAKAKHILIAPLDWGLGHTTRCIPLIRHILRLGHVPVFAGNASQRSFINENFGSIDNIHLEGYNITYSVWNRFAQAGILSQLPRVTRTIAAEHKWLQQLCSSRKIDGIISDNRYGLFHGAIPSVIITHQLQVRSGMGTMPDRAIQKLHYRLLNRFGAAWVADVPGTPNLAGDLSHSSSLPANAMYIGLLSQFEEVIPQEAAQGSLLVLLSGPEPQRTQLSRILWQQVQAYTGQATFIEGSERAPHPHNIPPHINWYGRVSNGLLPHLQQADVIISRSGYSTLMDLVALGKKAILIPTPGQTEQQYLAQHLHQQGIFLAAKQSTFDLSMALHQSQHFPWHQLPLTESYTRYRKVLSDWIETL